jgi:hypothetical protein
LNATGKKRVQIVITCGEHAQCVTLVKKLRGSVHVWYFICPKTGKESYYLYLVNGEYGHRDAFKPYAMYQRQTYSAKARLYVQSQINVLKLPTVDLNRPTKRALRVLKKIEKAKAKRREWLAKYPTG